jgi:uncharacterized RDD family membrane protein YckC
MSDPAPDPTNELPGNELRPAGVGRRIAALVYDSFLIFGLWVVPLFIVTAASHRASLQTNSVVHDLPVIAPGPVILLYEFAIVLIFYGYFWRKNGQTLGMQAWRLRVDSISGGRPSLRQCLQRAAVGFIALACAGLGFWWIWLDREGRAWHDRASNTRVVVLPKRK